MPTAYDVPQEKLIARIADHLKHVSSISAPNWSTFSKTGSHAMRPPTEKDWWHMRCASLVRKIYVHGPIGLSRLEGQYGGRKELAYAPGQHRDAGGSAIRKALQQLESAGYVAKQGKKGRILTGKGVSLVDKQSTELLKELAKSRPELVRYI